MRLILVFFLLLTGCSSGPPLTEDVDYTVYDWGMQEFEKSPSNKYAITMRSHLFDRSDGYLDDKYINNDMDQITRLLHSKGYRVWYVPTVSKLKSALDKIREVSDSDTKTFFAYSGKGDKAGLRLYGKYVFDSKSHLIIPPNATITPDNLIPALSSIKGNKAVLINACEAGIFADYADKHSSTTPFNGVVIAACATGFLTTPYEYAEMSATFATFISHYEDDIKKTMCLRCMDIDTVGGWWYNLMHRLSNRIDRFTNSSLKPISYDTVKYRGGVFKL